MQQAPKKFLELIEIMNTLREKCPWDKAQTLQSLRSMTIEECYELSDGILNNDWENIKEELGDMLLHILFYSKIASEENKFTITDVLETIAAKLIRRHPHVYGNVEVENAVEVKKNWEQIKLQEKGNKPNGILQGVIKSSPSMLKAITIQEKVKNVGFEWENKEDVWRKFEEEIAEFKEASQQQNKEHMETELGDIFFSLINYARFIGINADAALEKTNQKFIKRFTALEKEVLEQGKSLEQMSLQEMDEIWNKIKKHKAVE